MLQRPTSFATVILCSVWQRRLRPLAKSQWEPRIGFPGAQKLQRKWAQSSSCQLSQCYSLDVLTQNRSHAIPGKSSLPSTMMFFSARMASHKSFATLFSVTLYLVNHVFSAHWQDILKLFQMSFRSLKSISIFFSLGFSGSWNRLRSTKATSCDHVCCPFQVSPRVLSRQRQRHPWPPQARRKSKSPWNKNAKPTRWSRHGPGMVKSGCDGSGKFRFRPALLSVLAPFASQQQWCQWCVTLGMGQQWSTYI